MLLTCPWRWPTPRIYIARTAPPATTPAVPALPALKTPSLFTPTRTSSSRSATLRRQGRGSFQGRYYQIMARIPARAALWEPGRLDQLVRRRRQAGTHLTRREPRNYQDIIIEAVRKPVQDHDHLAAGTHAHIGSKRHSENTGRATAANILHTGIQLGRPASPTIISRTQIVTVPLLGDDELAGYLQQHNNVDPERAAKVAQLADGNINLAFRLLEES